MTTAEVFHYVEQEIHSTIMATVDEQGLPVTCAIDIMDTDEGGIYFLTARGKGFYRRLKARGFAAFTGMKGGDTLSCVAVSIRGKVREIGQARLSCLLDKNPYMYQIYPTPESRQALTVFQLYQGEGEWFDLSKKPIDRFSFSFGQEEAAPEGYFITEACTGCRACERACPQNCIDFSEALPHIRQEHCLHCGNCQTVCSVDAVERRQGA